MSKRLPFGWHALSPEAEALLRDQPHRFERVTLTDGPVAHGRLFAGPAPKPAQLDLFSTNPPEDAGDETGDLFA